MGATTTLRSSRQRRRIRQCARCGREEFGLEHPLEKYGLKALTPSAKFAVHLALDLRRHGILAAKRRQVAQRAGVDLA